MYNSLMRLRPHSAFCGNIGSYFPNIDLRIGPLITRITGEIVQKKVPEVLSWLTGWVYHGGLSGSPKRQAGLKPWRAK
jgi:hypothetical protein